MRARTAVLIVVSTFLLLSVIYGMAVYRVPDGQEVNLFVGLLSAWMLGVKSILFIMLVAALGVAFALIPIAFILLPINAFFIKPDKHAHMIFWSGLASCIGAVVALLLYGEGMGWQVNIVGWQVNTIFYHALAWGSWAYLVQLSWNALEK